jgi:spermidine synthase
MTEPIPQELGRAVEPTGEVVLRRRGEHLELVVDGRFAMDTVDTSTERELAASALDRLAGPGPFGVLVAGLGLGFTAAAVLADARVARVEVVELSAAVAGWVRDGLVPATADLVADPRLTVEVADVATAVAARTPGSLDAVLLDVDNGLGFLIHDRNAALYDRPFLAAALRLLRPGGVLAVWSSHPSPELADRLAAAGGAVEELLRTVERDGRRLGYALYLARPR